MWPFSRRKSRLIPVVRCGNIDVVWDISCEHWEFTDGEFDYYLRENNVLDPSLLGEIHVIRQWLRTLDSQIDSVIAEHLQGWCEWTGNKRVVGIDASHFGTKRQIDVAYVGDDNWGDLGINIIFTDGEITDSYAGD